MRIGCVLLAIALCASAAWAGAADKLVIVSPHPEGIQYEFADAFAAQYKRETGREVAVNWQDVGGTSNINRFIQSEFKSKPNGIDVDLYFGGGTDPHLELKKLGLLAPYRVPDEILRHVAPDINGVPLYDSDFCWYAATMAGFGIIYNKVVVQMLRLPEPKTWEDLARPALAGWVGSADPRKSGSVHMCYEIMLQAYGWERGWQIITALGANVRGFSAGAGQTPKDVAVGEVAYGLAIDFYAWSQVREVGEERIGYVMPEGLTMVNGDAISMLKGAPNREVAEAFIRFVLSETGQKLWLLRQGDPEGPKKYELGRFSVLPELYAKVKGRTVVTVNPFEGKSAFTYDAEKGSARYEIVNDLIGAFLIDPHDRLAATWKRAIREGKAEADLRRLAAMPLSEDQAQVLAREGRWKDAEFRNRTMSEWASLARSRYLPAPAGRSALRNLPAILAFAGAIAMFIYMRRRSRVS
jgi:ABC-type Fe3+ transport system substrate-binding protein